MEYEGELEIMNLQEAVPVVDQQNGPRILVVDDEVAICRSLEGVFRDEGFEVVIAASGEEALTLVGQDPPSLILLDIWMPGLDGIATLERLQEIAPKIPVIMISGHATIPTAIQATRMGAFDFIEKPLDLHEILTAVRRALGHGEELEVPREDEVGIPAQEQPLFGKRGASSVRLQSEFFTTQESRGMVVPQRTLAQSAVLYGHGVHTGRKSGLLLEPLPPDSGIHFAGVAGDIAIPAHVDFVDSSGWATTLRIGQVQASTIEHLMSVLHAYGITNLLVKCNGEVPVMDGSALEFCDLIERAGIKEQGGDWYQIVPSEIIECRGGREWIRLEPAQSFEIDYTLEYPEPIGKQHMVFHLSSPEAFKEEIAPARTFGFVKDIGLLQKRGLAQGGRFDNFVLIGAEGVINSDLRYPNELVRHKILDAIGDFYLLGRPLGARITAYMTGHSDNVSVIQQLWLQLKELSKQSQSVNS